MKKYIKALCLPLFTGTPVCSPMWLGDVYKSRKELQHVGYATEYFSHRYY